MGVGEYMVKDTQKLDLFEKEFLKSEKTNLKKNFKIIEALYDEAVALGALPFENPLEGIEVDIRIARVINSVLKSP